MNLSFKLWPHGVGALGAVALTYLVLRRAAPVGGKYRSAALHTVTWNVAAINNNPFEYWITHSDPAYNRLMQGVQGFIDAPGAQDVPVKDVFSQTMFDELKAKMTQVGWTGIDQVEAAWNSDFKNRRIISGFIKDSKIGKKRLASMPDRITNTITTADGKEVYRPTVINCYDGDLSDGSLWWRQWKEFMFDRAFMVTSKSGVVSKPAYSMLSKIPHAKYPDVSPEEEAISLPLQTLCCAIFDAIMVHMMNVVDAAAWQGLRGQLCSALNKNKVRRTLEILSQSYGDADIIFLQEASVAMATEAKSVLGDRFTVHLPADMDSVRDQNSLILTKNAFLQCQEVTSTITTLLDKDLVAKGDLFVLSCVDTTGKSYLLASFHGDTNGLASIPVVTAVHQVLTKTYPEHRLIFGLDANTYADDSKGTQNLFEFADACTALGLSSNWGIRPDPTLITTFNARTFLQPQLNKAVKYNEKDVKGDRNLKDFILFTKKDFTVASFQRDNTGSGAFIENMVIPSLQFPSDHCLLEAFLTPTFNSNM